MKKKPPPFNFYDSRFPPYCFICVHFDGNDKPEAIEYKRKKEKEKNAHMLDSFNSISFHDGKEIFFTQLSRGRNSFYSLSLSARVITHSQERNVRV